MNASLRRANGKFQPSWESLQQYQVPEFNELT
jgi:hypothetical protein